MLRIFFASLDSSLIAASNNFEVALALTAVPEIGCTPPTVWLTTLHGGATASSVLYLCSSTEDFVGEKIESFSSLLTLRSTMVDKLMHAAIITSVVFTYEPYCFNVCIKVVCSRLTKSGVTPLPKANPQSGNAHIVCV